MSFLRHLLVTSSVFFGHFDWVCLIKCKIKTTPIPGNAAIIFAKKPNHEYLAGSYPAGNYMLKVNNRNSRTRYEVCSKLLINIPL